MSAHISQKAIQNGKSSSASRRLVRFQRPGPTVGADHTCDTYTARILVDGQILLLISGSVRLRLSLMHKTQNVLTNR